MTFPENARTPSRLPFEEPRLIKNDAWTLENITANIGGFFSDNGHGGRIRPLRPRNSGRVSSPDR
ncbi:MAG: hypothetical protein AB1486_18740 [Planctomycetota bacterium]